MDAAANAAPWPGNARIYKAKSYHTYRGRQTNRDTPWLRISHGLVKVLGWEFNTTQFCVLPTTKRIFKPEGQKTEAN